VHYHTRYLPTPFLFLCVLLLALAACGGGGSTNSTSTNTLAAKQVLRFPNVGLQDSASLDPAQGPDANTAQIVSMIYNGLVKSDVNLNVVPDQASSWDISSDNKVYTFHLRPGLSFSDGTSITAQTYVYTWTRALLPEVKSGIASFFEASIVGANDVNSGKTKTLAGV